MKDTEWRCNFCGRSNSAAFEKCCGHSRASQGCFTPTKKYRVTVLREICHEVELIVEAESSDKAKQLAQEAAPNFVLPKKHPTEYRVLAIKIEQ